MTTCGPAARYRRTGVVTATRLTDSLTWTTSAGDVLTGRSGDWLVVTRDGGERTVQDPQFRSSYEQLEGDLWQRVGTVTAARVREEHVVETLEGPATARVGDWLVTAPDGTRWPVPDPVFRNSYEPVDHPEIQGEQESS